MLYRVTISGIEAFNDIGYVIAEEKKLSDTEIEQLYAHDLKMAVQLLNEWSFDHYFMRLDDAKAFLAFYDYEWR